MKAQVSGGSLKWYPLAAATRWIEATAKKVAALPDWLDERNEAGAATRMRRLLASPDIVERFAFIVREFDLSCRPELTVRQKNVSDLRAEATEIEAALAALQARQASVLGALTRAGREPVAVDRAGLTKAFASALAAMDEISVRLTEVEGAVLAEAGPDRGGPPLTAPSAPHIEAFGEALAELWTSEGLSLVGKEGQAFLAILRAVNEAVTGSEDIKSEARVISRLRERFCKNPPRKS